MIFTNMRVLSDILYSLSPGNGFSIRGVIETEADYTASVLYETPGAKPAWADVLSKRPDEQMNQVRDERNILLADCDWTQASDSSLSAGTKESWIIYRQELRDIPENNADPFNISWPTAP